MAIEQAVTLGIEYFPDPTKGRPLFNSNVYIGEVDLDPEIEANRITVTVIQEDSTRVAILPSAQPLLTGSGGVILYLGSPVSVVVDVNYSIKTTDQLGAQVYYVPFVQNNLVTLLEIVTILESTVADMVANSSLVEGNTVETVSYYAWSSTAPAAQAVYNIVSAANYTTITGNAVPDELGDHTLDNGAVAMVVRSQPLNVMQWGAKGDGATNDAPAIQAAVTDTNNIYFPDGIYNVETTIQIHSDTYLTGEGTIRRTDSSLDIFQAIGTQGTHVKNITVEGLHFRDETIQSAGILGYPSMLRVAYGDDITVRNNNFFNVNAIRSGVSALHDSADEQAAYASITDANMNQRFTITNNVGYCANTASASSGGSYFAALTYTRDFVISNNVFEGYLDGLYVTGGYLTAVDPVDSVLKAHTGTIAGNSCDPVRVGLWCWSARNILFDGNVIRDCTNESLDAESSANIIFQNNHVISGGGAGISVFFNVRNIQYLNNTIEMDQSGGSAPIFNASLPDADNKDIIMKGNTFTALNGTATFNPLGNSYLQVEDNTFNDVRMVLTGPMGSIDINNNKFIYNVNPVTKPIDFGGNILDPTLAVNFERPTLNVKYNEFINNTGAAIGTTCIEVGHSTVPCWYNFIGNNIPNFSNGINLVPGYVQVPNNLHTIVTKDNQIDVTSNFMLIQDGGITDADISHVFTYNTNAAGLGLWALGSPPGNTFYSIGSIGMNPTPSAAGSIGSVCTASGKSGSWNVWGPIT